MITATQQHRTTSEVNPPERIPAGLSILSICGITLLLVLFNVVPHRIGVLLNAADSTSFIPLLNPEFLDTFLPWLNAWWGLAMALSFVHLGLRRWTFATHLADLGLSMFGLAILLTLVNGVPILSDDPQWVVAGQPTLQVPGNLVEILSLGITIVLWLAIIGTVIDIVKKVLNLLRGRWSTSTATSL